MSFGRRARRGRAVASRRLDREGQAHDLLGTRARFDPPHDHLLERAGLAGPGAGGDPDRPALVVEDPALLVGWDHSGTSAPWDDSLNWHHWQSASGEKVNSSAAIWRHAAHAPLCGRRNPARRSGRGAPASRRRQAWGRGRRDSRACPALRARAPRGRRARRGRVGGPARPRPTASPIWRSCSRSGGGRRSAAGRSGR